MPALVDEICAVGGMISVNRAYHKTEQAKVWIHELAHLHLFAIAPHLLQ